MEKSLLWTITALALISVILSCVAIFNQPIVPTASEVAKLVVIPAVTSTVEYNDSSLKADIAAVQLAVSKDDNWKVEAQKLAEAEYTDRHLYNALTDLNFSIDSKSDIDKFVIKDNEVTSFDVDDKDATIVQDVRVYFEDTNGDSKRANLVITTTIRDGDIDDTIYELD